jgi:glycosyltransferase involved in cell wall biosynthesis
MKISIIHNVITDYKTALFNEIGNNLKTENNDFEVVYIAPTENIREWDIDYSSIKFKHSFLSDKSLDNLSAIKTVFSIWKKLSVQNPDIVIIAEYIHIAYWVALFWAKLHRKKIGLWLDSHYLDKSRHPIKEKIKQLLVKRLDFGLASSTKSKDYFVSLGLAESMCSILGYAVDNDFYQKEYQQHLKNRKDILKELDLPQKNFIYVGRFAREKNLANLISCYHRAKVAGLEWGLILVGGGPLYERLSDYVEKNQIPDISMPGFIQKDNICKYYACSDLLILPSFSEPWGLVVNEAMACGLPVAVSVNCGCYPDIARDDSNAFVFDPNDDEKLYKILMASTKAPCLDQIGENSKKIIAEYTPQKVADRFIAAVSRLK